MFRVCNWNKGLLSACIALLLSACINDPLSEKREIDPGNTAVTGECAGVSDCSAPANATATCVSGTCAWTCDSGYHPNDPGNPTSCVDNGTLTSCGVAGVDCTASTPENGIASCDGSSCSYSCDTEAGFSQQADGSCFRECVSDTDCPGLSFGCIDNACVYPQNGGCNADNANSVCDGPIGADGEAMAGVCFAGPTGDLCVPACDPLDVDSCSTGSTLCQPLGALGDPTTVAICIPNTLGCSTAADCPSGVDACHGGVCVPPSGIACGGQEAGSDCSYAVNGETIEGSCFGTAPPYVCLTECNPLTETGCANPLNACQPTGAIGAPDTDYVCIPGETFSGIETCPSGTAAFADGACITPSALAVDCAPGIAEDGSYDFSAPVGNSCSFEYFGTTVDGVCFGDGTSPAACVERCDASEANQTACSNPFTVCQPGGVIDPNDPAYFSACIPDSTFASSADCPTGTHGFDDATKACVAPSNEPCAASASGDACSFDFFGTEYVGTCFGDGSGPLSCLANCDVITATACETDSVCQPTGTIGDPATDFVCIPQGTFADDGDCLPGTHGYVDGACVAPSLIACLDGGTDEAGNPTSVPDTTACSFDYFGNTLEGRCFTAVEGLPSICLAACEPALVDETGNLVLTDEGGLTQVACVNPNNNCQALDVIAPGVPSVCIPNNTFTAAADCPSGTHAVDNADGTFECVSPSGLACLGKLNLDACGFDYFGETITGQCFEGACLATCDGTIVDGDGTEACGNPNSTCQATGAIGDPTTGYVCIPSNTFSEAGQCPSGTNEVAQDDGTFLCIPPSGEACVGLSDLDDCSFEYFGTALSGTCFQGACLAECDGTIADGTATAGCGNANSYCQATGAIGAPDTEYVCIPGNTFTESGACPSGTFEVDNGDGTFYCIPPSGEPCAALADFDACTFDYFGTSLSGQCYAGACLAQCNGVTGEGCGNSNSYCQALGVIGDPEASYLCTPADTFTADDTCPTGTHERDNGDGTYNCVPPSAIACDGLDTLAACQYSYFGQNFSGQCFNEVCLPTCDGAVVDGDGTEGCNNANNVCQATGAIGDPTTGYVCIPSNTFTESGTCPSGTFEVDNGDGTFDCIPPSAEGCNIEDATDDGSVNASNLGSPCSYDYFGTTLSGVCFGSEPGALACVDVCADTIGGDIVASAGFENGDTVSTNIGTYNVSGDVWGIVSQVGSISGPSAGDSFWGMQDLDNGNGGGSGYHTITVGPIDMSTVGASTLSFDYQSVGYESSDNIGFLVVTNGDSVPDLDVDDSALVQLQKDTAGQWVSIDFAVAADVTSATLVLAAKQNGGSDYAGFDNVTVVSAVQGLTARECDNAASTCQATGALGDPATGYVCIPADTFTAADQCPSGTHAVDQGDGTFDCIPPDGVGCNVADVVDNGTPDMSNLGSACSFDYLGQTLSGVCFGAAPGALACVDTCSPTSVDGSGNVVAASYCTNTNSTCQATGAIGDPATIGVCIPGDTFTAAEQCPSGTHPMDQGDGTFDCVPPSGIECNGGDLLDDGSANLSNLGTACSFTHDGNTISGVCFGAAPGALACVDTCSPASVDGSGNLVAPSYCTNTNSTCQATGAIGDAATIGVCIPGDTFTAANQCPSGTHPMDQGDGTFDCVPPSGIECNGADFADDGTANLSNLGDPCTFEHDGNTMSGVCFGAAPGALACVDICAPDDGSAYPAYAESACANTNSTCQATGAVGDPATIGVCIPADTFTAASDCPSGTHAIDQGDGTFDCIPPSAVGCNVLDVVDDTVANMSTLGAACSFDYFGQTVSGVCFGSAPGALACVDTCSPTSVDGSGNLVAPTYCGNTNSTCQATGAIGDPATIGVCIPGDTFTAASECPSGTHAVDQGDGTFDCVPPSGIECNGLDADPVAFAGGGDLYDLMMPNPAYVSAVDTPDQPEKISVLGQGCTFDHDGNSISGVCYGSAPGALACVATCSPDNGAAFPDNNGVMCLNSNSTCQATGAIGDPATIGVCIPSDTFTAASECPSGTYVVDNGDGTVDCVPPSAIGCNVLDLLDDGDANKSTLGNDCSFTHDGNTLTGKCFGAAPGGLACLDVCSDTAADEGFNAFYTAGARPSCENPISVCQPTGAIGDPSTFGACIPRDLSTCAKAYDEAIADGSSEAVAEADAYAAAPAGTFGCSEDGAALVPSVVDCVTGYVCADPATGDPTATVCNPFTPGATGCAADALCAIPTFAPTGAVCGIDADNDGVSDAAGFCLAIPDNDLGASVCLPDCAGQNGGDVTGCEAVDSEGLSTAYCQPLEAKGQGILVDLGDNLALDGSAGHPRPDDIAVCLPVDNTCSEDSDCDTATSVGCSAGVCQTPSLNACTGTIPGVGVDAPGYAVAGTPCDPTSNAGSTDGYCVPSGNTDSSGNSLQICLVGCDPTAGGTLAGDCGTADAICADFTDLDPTDGVPGAGLFVCVPAP